jgi:hypothetical protein
LEIGLYWFLSQKIRALPHHRQRRLWWLGRLARAFQSELTKQQLTGETPVPLFHNCFPPDEPIQSSAMIVKRVIPCTARDARHCQMQEKMLACSHGSNT